MKAFPTPPAVQVCSPGLRALHWLMAALIFAALPLGCLVRHDLVNKSFVPAKPFRDLRDLTRYAFG